MNEKQIKVKPLIFTTGEASKLLNIFKGMYFSDYLKAKKKEQKMKEGEKDVEIEENKDYKDYWRHWVLHGFENGIVFFQKRVSTNLNQFILYNPSSTDMGLITGFCKTYNLKFFERPRIDLAEEA
ncbi:MAG: hypothetical protein ACKKMR_02210 [Candidatus Nealsonbacteria bacterium]